MAVSPIVAGQLRLVDPTATPRSMPASIEDLALDRPDAVKPQVLPGINPKELALYQVVQAMQAGAASDDPLHAANLVGSYKQGGQIIAPNQLLRNAIFSDESGLQLAPADVRPRAQLLRAASLNRYSAEFQMAEAQRRNREGDTAGAVHHTKIAQKLMYGEPDAKGEYNPEGGGVGEIISALVDESPHLEKLLYDENGVYDEARYERLRATIADHLLVMGAVEKSKSDQLVTSKSTGKTLDRGTPALLKLGPDGKPELGPDGKPRVLKPGVPALVDTISRPTEDAALRNLRGERDISPPRDESTLTSGLGLVDDDDEQDTSSVHETEGEERTFNREGFVSRHLRAILEQIAARVQGRAQDPTALGLGTTEGTAPEQVDWRGRSLMGTAIPSVGNYEKLLERYPDPKRGFEQLAGGEVAPFFTIAGLTESNAFVAAAQSTDVAANNARRQDASGEMVSLFDPTRGVDGLTDDQLREHLTLQEGTKGDRAQNATTVAALQRPQLVEAVKEMARRVSQAQNEVTAAENTQYQEENTEGSTSAATGALEADRMTRAVYSETTGEDGQTYRTPKYDRNLPEFLQNTFTENADLGGLRDDAFFIKVQERAALEHSLNIAGVGEPDQETGNRALAFPTPGGKPVRRKINQLSPLEQRVYMLFQGSHNGKLNDQLLGMLGVGRAQQYDEAERLLAQYDRAPQENRPALARFVHEHVRGMNIGDRGSSIDWAARLTGQLATDTGSSRATMTKQAATARRQLALARGQDPDLLVRRAMEDTHELMAPTSNGEMERVKNRQRDVVSPTRTVRRPIYDPSGRVVGHRRVKQYLHPIFSYAHPHTTGRAHRTERDRFGNNQDLINLRPLLDPNKDVDPQIHMFVQNFLNLGAAALSRKDSNAGGLRVTDAQGSVPGHLGEKWARTLHNTLFMNRLLHKTSDAGVDPTDHIAGESFTGISGKRGFTFSGANWYDPMSKQEASDQPYRYGLDEVIKHYRGVGRRPQIPQELVQDIDTRAYQVQEKLKEAAGHRERVDRALRDNISREKHALGATAMDSHGQRGVDYLQSLERGAAHGRAYISQHEHADQIKKQVEHARELFRHTPSVAHQQAYEGHVERFQAANEVLRRRRDDRARETALQGRLRRDDPTLERLDPHFRKISRAEDILQEARPAHPAYQAYRTSLDEAAGLQRELDDMEDRVEGLRAHPGSAEHLALADRLERAQNWMNDPEMRGRFASALDISIQAGRFKGLVPRRQPGSRYDNDLAIDMDPTARGNLLENFEESLFRSPEHYASGLEQLYQIARGADEGAVDLRHIDQVMGHMGAGADEVADNHAFWENQKDGDSSRVVHQDGTTRIKMHYDRAWGTGQNVRVDYGTPVFKGHDTGAGPEMAYREEWEEGGKIQVRDTGLADQMHLTSMERLAMPGYEQRHDPMRRKEQHRYLSALGLGLDPQTFQMASDVDFDPAQDPRLAPHRGQIGLYKALDTGFMDTDLAGNRPVDFGKVPKVADFMKPEHRLHDQSFDFEPAGDARNQIEGFATHLATHPQGALKMLMAMRDHPRVMQMGGGSSTREMVLAHLLQQLAGQTVLTGRSGDGKRVGLGELTTRDEHGHANKERNPNVSPDVVGFQPALLKTLPALTGLTKQLRDAMDPATGGAGGARPDKDISVDAVLPGGLGDQDADWYRRLVQERLGHGLRPASGPVAGFGGDDVIPKVAGRPGERERLRTATRLNNISSHVLRAAYLAQVPLADPQTGRRETSFEDWKRGLRPEDVVAMRQMRVARSERAPRQDAFHFRARPRFSATLGGKPVPGSPLLPYVGGRRVPRAAMLPFEWTSAPVMSDEAMRGMREHFRDAPAERGGYLVGTHRFDREGKPSTTVTHFVPARGTGSSRGWQTEAGDRERVMAEQAQEGGSVVGFVHNHPGGTMFPSQADVRANLSEPDARHATGIYAGGSLGFYRGMPRDRRVQDVLGGIPAHEPRYAEDEYADSSYGSTGSSEVPDWMRDITPDSISDALNTIRPGGPKRRGGTPPEGPPPEESAPGGPPPDESVPPREPLNWEDINPSQVHLPKPQIESILPLDDEQRAAANSEARLTITKGDAGTGKSYSILGTIERALLRGIAPKQITYVTFNNATAQKMREDTAALQAGLRKHGVDTQGHVNIGTFHGHGMQWLAENYEHLPNTWDLDKIRTGDIADNEVGRSTESLSARSEHDQFKFRPTIWGEDEAKKHLQKVIRADWHRTNRQYDIPLNGRLNPKAQAALETETENTWRNISNWKGTYGATPGEVEDQLGHHTDQLGRRTRNDQLFDQTRYWRAYEERKGQLSREGTSQAVDQADLVSLPLLAMGASAKKDSVFGQVQDYWRNEAQNDNKVVIADEAQNMSPIHHRWLKLFQGEDTRNTIVWDPKQAAAGYRNALSDADAAARVTLGVDDPARFTLHRNYRSRANIVNTITGAFRGLFPKEDETVPATDAAGNVLQPGGIVHYQPFATRGEEQKEILRRIQEHIASQAAIQGANLGDPEVHANLAAGHGIFSRTNKSANAMREVLESAGVPVAPSQQQKTARESELMGEKGYLDEDDKKELDEFTHRKGAIVSTSHAAPGIKVDYAHVMGMDEYPTWGAQEGVTNVPKFRDKLKDEDYLGELKALVLGVGRAVHGVFLTGSEHNGERPTGLARNPFVRSGILGPVMTDQNPHLIDPATVPSLHTASPVFTGAPNLQTVATTPLRPADVQSKPVDMNLVQINGVAVTATNGAVPVSAVDPVTGMPPQSPPSVTPITSADLLPNSGGAAPPVPPPPAPPGSPPPAQPPAEPPQMRAYVPAQNPIMPVNQVPMAGGQMAESGGGMRSFAQIASSTGWEMSYVGQRLQTPFQEMVTNGSDYGKAVDRASLNLGGINPANQKEVDAEAQRLNQESKGSFSLPQAAQLVQASTHSFGQISPKTDDTTMAVSQITGVDPATIVHDAMVVASDFNMWNPQVQGPNGKMVNDPHRDLATNTIERYAFNAANGDGYMYQNMVQGLGQIGPAVQALFPGTPDQQVASYLAYSKAASKVSPPEDVARAMANVDTLLTKPTVQQELLIGSLQAGGDVDKGVSMLGAAPEAIQWEQQRGQNQLQAVTMGIQSQGNLYGNQATLGQQQMQEANFGLITSQTQNTQQIAVLQMQQDLLPKQQALTDLQLQNAQVQAAGQAQLSVLTQPLAQLQLATQTQVNAGQMAMLPTEQTQMQADVALQKMQMAHAEYQQQYTVNTEIPLEQAQQTASVASQENSLQTSREQLGFNIAYNAAMYGPPGDDQSKLAGYAFQGNQQLAGRSKILTDIGSQPVANVPVLGLANQEFYSGIQHQQQQLLYGRSPLTQDLAFKSNMDYLDQQKKYYEEQRVLDKQKFEADVLWQNRSLDFAQKQLDATVALEKAQMGNKVVQAGFTSEELGARRTVLDATVALEQQNFALKQLELTTQQQVLAAQKPILDLQQSLENQALANRQKELDDQKAMEAETFLQQTTTLNDSVTIANMTAQDLALRQQSNETQQKIVDAQTAILNAQQAALPAQVKLMNDFLTAQILQLQGIGAFKDQKTGQPLDLPSVLALVNQGVANLKDANGNPVDLNTEAGQMEKMQFLSKFTENPKDIGALTAMANLTPAQLAGSINQITGLPSKPGAPVLGPPVPDYLQMVGNGDFSAEQLLNASVDSATQSFIKAGSNAETAALAFHNVYTTLNSIPGAGDLKIGGFAVGQAFSDIANILMTVVPMVNILALLRVAKGAGIGGAAGGIGGAIGGTPIVPPAGGAAAGGGLAGKVVGGVGKVGGAIWDGAIGGALWGGAKWLGQGAIDSAKVYGSVGGKILGGAGRVLPLLGKFGGPLAALAMGGLALKDVFSNDSNPNMTDDQKTTADWHSLFNMVGLGGVDAGHGWSQHLTRGQDAIGVGIGQGIHTLGTGKTGVGDWLGGKKNGLGTTVHGGLTGLADFSGAVDQWSNDVSAHIVKGLASATKATTGWFGEQEKIWTSFGAGMAKMMDTWNTERTTAFNTWKTARLKEWQEFLDKGGLLGVVDAGFKDIKTRIDTGLGDFTTAISQFMGLVSKDWTEFWGTIETTMRTVLTSVEKGLVASVETLKSTFGDFTTFVSKNWGDFWDTVGTDVSTTVTNVQQAIDGGVAGFTQSITDFITTIGKAWGDFWTGLQQAPGAFNSWAQANVPGYAGAGDLAGAIGGVGGDIASGVSHVAGGAAVTAGGIKSTVGNVLGNVFGPDSPHLDAYHDAAATAASKHIGDNLIDRCEQFVDDIFGVADRTGRGTAFSTAMMFQQQGSLHQGLDISKAPVGARLYFANLNSDGSVDTGGAGHVTVKYGQHSMVGSDDNGVESVDPTTWEAKAHQKYIGYYLDPTKAGGPENYGLGAGNITPGGPDQAPPASTPQDFASRLDQLLTANGLPVFIVDPTTGIPTGSHVGTDVAPNVQGTSAATPPDLTASPDTAGNTSGTSSVNPSDTAASPYVTPYNETAVDPSTQVHPYDLSIKNPMTTGLIGAQSVGRPTLHSKPEPVNTGKTVSVTIQKLEINGDITSAQAEKIQSTGIRVITEALKSAFPEMN